MLLCGVAIGCQKASPTRPTVEDTASVSAASVTDARTGVTIVAARPASPAANASISWASQPITISVTNGVTSNGSALTYTFQVATDAAFIDRILESRRRCRQRHDECHRRQTARFEDLLLACRQNPASGTGPYSTTRVRRRPEVTLGTPSLASPVNGARAFSPVNLTINNITFGPRWRHRHSGRGPRQRLRQHRLYDGRPGRQWPDGRHVAAQHARRRPDALWRAKAADRANGITTP